ncbi:MAG: DUF294 nucleotidyltransferase-like domain-containing protein [Chitinophagales bacterium]
MASNHIASRVADFLKKFPPFSYLSKEALLEVAESVEVQYFGKKEAIFEEGGSINPFAYVLHKGRIDIIKAFEGSTQLIDMCDEGDIFGVRAALNNKPYLGAAIAEEDSLLYAIPQDVFLDLLAKNAKVALFFASGFASGMPVVHAEANIEEEKEAKRNRKELYFFAREGGTQFMSQEDILIVSPIEDVLCSKKTESIQSVANKMKINRVGSTVVTNDQNHPIGIVTDTDFTRKVVAKGIAPHSSISEIMSSPVRTILPHSTVSEYIIQMMKHKVRHLVVTEDGSSESPILGIASEHDILLLHGNDPAILVKRMLKARSIDKLAQIRNRAEQLIINYLKQEVSIEFITDIMTEINDVLIHRAIEFSLQRLETEGIERPPLQFCWLSLGSEGRGEQLLRTDQDNAIVYENPSEEWAEKAAAYFLKLGTYTVEILHACGFALCKGKIMASNPKWNQPLKVWKGYFADWIGVPEPMALMHSSIFFDLRGTYGKIELADELQAFILQKIEEGRGGFLNFLAMNTLKNPPPLSFFKNFIVEKSGENKDLFDIKLRSMMPLTDAARLLTLAEKQTNIHNTFKRFEQLKTIIPERAELFDEAAMAYELFVRYRALNGFENKDSGRFIQPENLNKIERQTLRTAFQTVETIQLYLKHRFEITYL